MDYNAGMDEKQKRIAKLTTIVSVILIFIALVALIYNIIALTVDNGRKADLERQSAALQEQIDNLDDEIEYRNTKDFVERYARDRLNMKYPDEEIYETDGSDEQ